MAAKKIYTTFLFLTPNSPIINERYIDVTLNKINIVCALRYSDLDKSCKSIFTEIIQQAETEIGNVTLLIATPHVLSTMGYTSVTLAFDLSLADKEILWKRHNGFLEQAFFGKSGEKMSLQAINTWYSDSLFTQRLYDLLSWRYTLSYYVLWICLVSCIFNYSSNIPALAGFFRVFNTFVILVLAILRTCHLALFAAAVRGMDQNNLLFLMFLNTFVLMTCTIVAYKLLLPEKKRDLVIDYTELEKSTVV